MAPSKAHLNRMMHDVRSLMDAPPAGISAWLPQESDLTLVEAQLVGPEDTPYARGIFQLLISFPDRYPHEPPNVKFKTKVYHPNVSHDGNICLSVLNMPPKGDWTPALSLRTVLLSIQSLLSAPNPDDPLDADAAKELKTHPHLFRSRAAEWTRIHASPGARTAASAAIGKAAAPGEPTSGAAGPSGVAADANLSSAARRQGMAAEMQAPEQAATAGPGTASADQADNSHAALRQEAETASLQSLAAAGASESESAIARRTEEAQAQTWVPAAPSLKAPQEQKAGAALAANNLSDAKIEAGAHELKNETVPRSGVLHAFGAGTQAMRPVIGAHKSRLALGKRTRA